MIVAMKNPRLVGRFNDNHGLLSSPDGNFDFDNVERAQCRAVQGRASGPNSTPARATASRAHFRAKAGNRSLSAGAPFAATAHEDL
ncbi:predicted protein [Brucella abortus]|uniref:Uncharacterized protein n=1 Tax=Brucella abortus (strain 2308) TaxID=359391 RepID=Q2YKB1_BRUA2|nr:conserved hypothetical protein [Brucella abortus 2308]SHO32674.1 predicted protein [Brucella abortus]